MSIVPTKNKSSLVAYYCGIFSLIPCVSLILGPIAVIAGFMGLKNKKENPEVSGTVHSWIGIVVGSFTFLAHLIFVAMAFLA